VPDYDAVLETLAAIIQRAAILQAAPDLDADEDGLTERARTFANASAPEDLQLWYQIALAGRRDLPLAPSPRAGCEMTLLRMLAFRVDGPGEGSPAPTGGRAATERRAPATKPSARPAGKPAASGRSAREPSGRAQEPVPAATRPLDSTADWEALIESVELGGATRQLARHCGFAGRDGELVKLVIDPAHEYLATRAQQDRLRDALKPALGSSLRLQIDPGKPVGETAADKAARAQMERQAEAENAIGGDPFVREMQKVFDATVDPDSIRPVD